jgi:hypothetical protein
VNTYLNNQYSCLIHAGDLWTLETPLLFLVRDVSKHQHPQLICAGSRIGSQHLRSQSPQPLLPFCLCLIAGDPWYGHTSWCYHPACNGHTSRCDAPRCDPSRCGPAPARVCCTARWVASQWCPSLQAPLLRQCCQGFDQVTMESDGSRRQHCSQWQQILAAAAPKQQLKQQRLEQQQGSQCVLGMLKWVGSPFHPVHCQDCTNPLVPQLERSKESPPWGCRLVCVSDAVPHDCRECSMVCLHVPKHALCFQQVVNGCGLVLNPSGATVCMPPRVDTMQNPSRVLGCLSVDDASRCPAISVSGVRHCMVGLPYRQLVWQELQLDRPDCSDCSLEGSFDF